MQEGKTRMATKSYSVNQMRQMVKSSIVAHLKKNGIKGLKLPIAPSYARHPYVILCRSNEVEYGIYLSDTGYVKQYLRAISHVREIDAKMLKLSEGVSVSRLVTENSKKSRNVLEISRDMKWWVLSSVDYDQLLKDCNTLLAIFNKL